MRSSRPFALALGLALCTQTFAGLTAEQIIEKNIAATGGRAAYAMQKSLVMKGTLEMTAQGMKGSIVTYQKDPGKMLVVMTIPGVGDVKQGYDGKDAWAQDRMSGLRKLAGDEKAAFIREANSSLLRWRAVYSAVKVTGLVKVGNRETYRVKFIPKVGPPATQYFDVKTFLVLREDIVQKSQAGSMAIQSTLSDYRSVGGVKMPFKTVMTTPVGDMVVQLTQVEPNVAIPDSQFRVPARDPCQDFRKQGADPLDGGAVP